MKKLVNNKAVDVLRRYGQPIQPATGEVIFKGNAIPGFSRVRAQRENVPLGHKAPTPSVKI